MWKIKNSLILFLSTLGLTACSPINSVEPFDQRQAAILLKQFYIAKSTQQMIVINLPSYTKWKRINTSAGTIGTQLWLVPENQDERIWQESFRTDIFSYHYFSHITLDEGLQRMIRKIKLHCESIDEKIVNQQPNTLTFSLNISHCENEKNQWQVGKMIKGKDAIYVLRYTAMQDEVPTWHFQQAKTAIFNARLVDNPNYRP